MMLSARRQPTMAGFFLVFSSFSLLAAEQPKAAPGADALGSEAIGSGLCGLSIDIAFREGAPRDRFEFINASTKKWRIDAISLRLEDTVGKLIFDTEAGGKGVDVFQLFEVESGSAEMDTAVIPDDGGNSLDLTFSRFTAGDSFTFSIDVDDQLSASELGQIRVSDSEMAGGIVVMSLRDESGDPHVLELVFDDQSRSGVSGPAC